MSKSTKQNKGQEAISTELLEQKGSLRTDFFAIFVLIDVCFLPYIRQLSCLVSMLLLIFWYFLKINRIRRDKEFILFWLSVFLIGLSVVMSKFVMPNHVYAASGISVNPFNYTVTHTAIFLFAYLYYFCIKTEFSQKPHLLKKVENALIIVLTLLFLFALYYIASPGGFYTLRSFWTMSGTEVNATVQTASYYRYTGPFSDPNDAACISLAIGIAIFESSERMKVKYYSLIASIVILLATMSVTGLLSAGLFFFIKLIQVLKKQKIKPAPLFIIVVSSIVLILLMGGAGEIEVLSRAIRRMGDNGDSANTRIEIWKILLRNKGIFNYLLIGTGTAITVGTSMRVPHSGHLHLLYSYGLVVHLTFLYVFFRKQKGIKWKKYLYLIPLFTCFTINNGVYDARYIFLMVIVIAYAKAKLAYEELHRCGG